MAARGPGGVSVAVELRHRSWSDDAADTRRLLAGHGAAWVLIDEPKFRSSIRQALDAAPVADAPIAYVRLHGRNAAEWWDHRTSDDRYNYLYSHAELRPFADAARAAASGGRKALIYFNNHFSAKAVANAAILKRDLGQALPPDLPATMLTRYPELNSG